MKEYFSKDLKSLLEGLLEQDVKNRLTLIQAMKHPFFKKVDWEKLEEKRGLKPPIKPKAINNMKTTKADILELQDEAVKTPPQNLKK